MGEGYVWPDSPEETRSAVEGSSPIKYEISKRQALSFLMHDYGAVRSEKLKATSQDNLGKPFSSNVRAKESSSNTLNYKALDLEEEGQGKYPDGLDLSHRLPLQSKCDLHNEQMQVSLRRELAAVEERNQQTLREKRDQRAPHEEPAFDPEIELERASETLKQNRIDHGNYNFCSPRSMDETFDDISLWNYVNSEGALEWCRNERNLKCKVPLSAKGFNGKSRKNLSFFLQSKVSKTKICVYNMTGSCTKGEKCSFAHSIQELRDPPNLSKTQLCVQFSKSGTCYRGALCKFAHGKSELRFKLDDGYVNPEPKSSGTMCGNSWKENNDLNSELLGANSSGIHSANALNRIPSDKYQFLKSYWYKKMISNSDEQLHGNSGSSREVDFIGQPWVQARRSRGSFDKQFPSKDAFLLSARSQIPSSIIPQPIMAPVKEKPGLILFRVSGDVSKSCELDRVNEKFLLDKERKSLESYRKWLDKEFIEFIRKKRLFHGMEESIATSSNNGLQEKDQISRCITDRSQQSGTMGI